MKHFHPARYLSHSRERLKLPQTRGYNYGVRGTFARSARASLRPPKARAAFFFKRAPVHA
ncbi:hypothetical protein NXT01_02150 [Corynebacterium sp. ES2775-CONJ]|uniref:hypothetical protein n=1 Tax=Corynebacterium sp. ES2715-CONJ3 TaxID=2974028 RepID=UPI0021699E88|nr:hypothetical protein [Corynebacterium sp. ES2715-CONJ3]MCS4489394.1 hypothetical protein [Corynebacterium sp. ES2775-CONJ]